MPRLFPDKRAYQQLLPYKDAEAMGGALHNMAVCLIMLNDFDRALGCYRTARELLTQNSMPLLVAQADYNIAYLFYLRGDYQKAIEGLRGTRRLCQQNGDRYHAGLCDLDESEIYLELNLVDEAAQMSREACRQFEELQAGHELGRSVANLAIASHRQKNNVRSLDLLEKAKSIFAKENNDAWQALIDLYQALVLFDTGSCAPAERMCSQALEFFERSGLDRRAILCRLLLARISLTAGNLLGARRNCDMAIGKLARMEAPLLKYHANLILGRIQYAASEWRLAYESYNTARVELEKLRGHLQGEELKIAFVKNRMDVYEGLVELCLRKSSTSTNEEAFDYIERAKSRTLAELLVKMAPQHGDPQDERIAVLRGDLNWYYHRIETEQTRKDGISPQNIQRLRAEAHAKEEEFLRALRALQHDKERGALPWASDVMTLEQIRAKLPREATLLEYFQIGSHFVAAVVTREDLKIVQLAASASEVAGHLQMLEFQLSKFLSKKSARNSKRDPKAATEDRLRRLYEDLISPVAPFLREGHLILVPHGILHLLPFQPYPTKAKRSLTASHCPSRPAQASLRFAKATRPSVEPALFFWVLPTEWLHRSGAKFYPSPRLFPNRAYSLDAGPPSTPFARKDPAAK